MADDALNAADSAAENPARRRWGWRIAIGVVAILLACIWGLRAPITDYLVSDQLQKRDVVAQYKVAAIGPKRQRLTNVIIGDPRNPDLIARSVELDLGWTWSGPEVRAVRADGVRLRGRWIDGRISLGEVDKLLPPPSNEPFEWPDLELQLKDARARIETPWGSFGSRIEGNGPLRRDFVGTIALVSENLSAQGCSARRVTVYGNIRIADKPTFAGPVRADKIACRSSNIGLARLDSALRIETTRDFSQWQGRVKSASSGVRGAGVQLGMLAFDADFAGNARELTADAKIDAKLVAAFGMNVRQATATGPIGWSDAGPDGKLAVTLAGGAISDTQRRSLRNAISSLKDSSFASVLAPAMRVVELSSSNISAKFDVAIANERDGQRIDILAPTIAGSNGAAVRASADSKIAILLSGGRTRWHASGQWTTAGGGLPAAKLDLQLARNGAFRGRAILAPLVSGATRLALTPISIVGDRSGRFRIVGSALVSGQFGGARVDGLGMRYAAEVKPNGDFILAGGCQQVTIAQAAFTGFRLGRNRVQLCSMAGQPLLAYRGGKLAGQARVLSPDIHGWSSDNPLRATAQNAQINLAQRQWSIEGLALTLGSGDEASAFAIERLSGNDSAGRIDMASGTIGAIPLVMSGFAGDWAWANRELTLNGGGMVSDRDIEPRFNPLVSNDLTLRYSDGRIVAQAGLAEQNSLVPVVRVTMGHDFGNASGGADLAVADLRFGDKFQPDQLTPLALGVIANVTGAVSGQGRIDWKNDLVTSAGTFSATDSDFAAAFGPVRGATTSMTFDDLLGLHSLPGQTISLAEVNPGFPVLEGNIKYQLLDSKQIHIEAGSWPFAGGRLVLNETTLDFDENAVRRLEFELQGVDAAVFLNELGFANISASGVFDGVLPVEFSGLGGRIVGGKLTARRGGGQVAYVGELTNYNLGVMANFAFNMLKSLRYEAMEIGLNGDLDGEMLTDVRITGLSQGKGAQRNLITRQIEKLPIEFNVRINAPFRQLISSAKSLYDPAVYGQDILPTLIEARRVAGGKPVQPRASETVP